MRTTLTLDDDVADRLKQLADRRKSSFKETVNDVLRRGLSAQEARTPRKRQFKVETFNSGFRPGVDPLKLNQLSDDLEARHAAEPNERYGNCSPVGRVGGADT